MPRITHCTINFDRDLEYGESSALYLLAENTLKTTPTVKPKGQYVFRDGRVIAQYSASISIPEIVCSEKDIDFFCHEMLNFAVKYGLNLYGRLDAEVLPVEKVLTTRKWSCTFIGLVLRFSTTK